MGHPIYNIIAKRNDEPPQIILGAHYDTRMFADHDPDPANTANLSLAQMTAHQAWLFCLNLRAPCPKTLSPSGWSSSTPKTTAASKAGIGFLVHAPSLRKSLSSREAVVIVDMIGDADLNIYLERNSNVAIRTEIWATAEKLGYENNSSTKKNISMLDDHTPFLEAGIPAVDIIDFDYPYWHTTQDTPIKSLPKVCKPSAKHYGTGSWNSRAERSRSVDSKCPSTALRTN